jgi:hypothetical protein
VIKFAIRDAAAEAVKAQVAPESFDPAPQYALRLSDLNLYVSVIDEPVFVPRSQYDSVVTYIGAKVKPTVAATNMVSTRGEQMYQSFRWGRGSLAARRQKENCG